MSCSAGLLLEDPQRAELNHDIYQATNFTEKGKSSAAAMNVEHQQV